jgi:hypothetical protein
MTTVSKKNKYTFVLDGIDIKKIIKTYGIQIDPSITTAEQPPRVKRTKRKQTTALADLSTKSQNTVSFLDESKRQHSCIVSMIDHTSHSDVSEMRYNCFWCRHPFQTTPIGCPIRYIPTRVVKSYKSDISNGTRTISENITVERSKENGCNITTMSNDYYETNGIFCSFNCCQAWIDDNKQCHLYKQSKMLLLKLYNDLTGSEMDAINPAPSWYLLSVYGGTMSIKTFRSTFNHIYYTPQGIIHDPPSYKPIGHMFEENIKF